MRNTAARIPRVPTDRPTAAASSCVAWVAVAIAVAASPAAEFRGAVVDAETGRAIEARVYLQGPGGDWQFVESAAPEGSATPYREQWVPMPNSVELHSTVSAHPFRAELEPGEYRLTVERGKEYLPLERPVGIGDEPVTVTLPLVRWVDMASRGWYSGDTHVHRRVEELPQVMRAEDLNVAFPVTFWTTRAGEVPTTAPSPLRPTPDPLGPRRDEGPGPITVDDTHVIFPRNTEFEVFSVRDRRHVLGALSVLNHRTRFDRGAPPVAEIAERAHREGALLDLEKHNWPWSLMLVPVAKVDLFELSNNSVWRTAFGFRSSLVPPPPWTEVEQDAGGMTERGWLEFGFRTYYTLLNCGFPLRPTAGTASGVHPVPLGYGRVYVHTGGSFDGEAWLEGLRAGRSFVTTGPMLLVTADGQHPGSRFSQPAGAVPSLDVRGEAFSEATLETIELVVDGEVTHRIEPENRPGPRGGFVSPIEVTVRAEVSSWFAVRCFERRAEGRVRFAHTGPFHVEVGGEPVRPRRREAAWLAGRMREEIERNRGVLDDSSLEEYRQALQFYEQLDRNARD